VNSSTGAITLGGVLVAANGGTGNSVYAVGDLLYASTTSALSRLADVAAGSVLVSGGVGLAPSYSSAPSLSSLTLSGLTANSFLYSGTGGALTTTSAPINGQILVGVTGSAPAAVSFSGDVTLSQTGLTTVVAVRTLPIYATTGASSSIFFGYSSTVPSATQSISIGYQALNVATGTQNTAIGVTAGSAITTGTGNTLLGYASAVGATTASAVAIGSGASATSDQSVAIGQGITANQTGGFFMKHRGPISATVNTAGFIAGTNELVELTSSRRFKQNIRPLEDISTKFDLLRGVRFNAKPGYGNPEEEHIGMIAEEVEEVFPEFITKDPTGLTTGIMYDRMISLVIEELQALKRENAVMKAQIANLMA
jgi:hypothetical protein